ncbi:50S ribosomal protein L11 methyltransferase [Desulfopila inferna]|uniref:50S ribosomal protein L11 methyltransferase n=1 Tax=Desulfopila inferna TaxID=468528 RepID=UPI0019653E0A|nr:50S ribosomal protein L11 methyltransferase [Desulfopila inferna]MBM9606388.1 50S ribosomal protein L11 methyltransferase [Desulfopila inferna]
MQSAKLTPESMLHIYYLQGRIAKDKKIVNKNYLGTWEEDEFSFVFFLQEAPDAIEALIEEQKDLVLLDTYQMTYEQWQGGKIEPRQIGGFLVVPPWFTPPAEEPSTVITLDPGVVFGNGLHPTTRDCLQAIEITCAGGKVETMLDLGTGTGILALAAIKRGCIKAVAVDYNFLACRTARDNVVLNEMENNIVVINSQAEIFSEIPTDLLVANIHYDIMKDIIRSEGFLKQKWFVLSGLLTSEAAKVEEYLAGLPVLILQRWSQDGTWHTILGITATA